MSGTVQDRCSDVIVLSKHHGMSSNKVIWNPFYGATPHDVIQPVIMFRELCPLVTGGIHDCVPASLLLGVVGRLSGESVYSSHRRPSFESTYGYCI